MLTKEERVAKFATKHNDVGLRSRGHRKMSLEEQQSLYDNLSNQRPGPRLDQLRMLREAVQSADPTNRDQSFEIKVYARSIKESITHGQLDAVPHMLAHATEISSDPLWRRLFLISLSNKEQFHQALLLCNRKTDWQYVTSLVNKDVPLWEYLVSREQDAIAKTLMMQVKSKNEQQKQEALRALRPPGGTTLGVNLKG